MGDVAAVCDLMLFRVCNLEARLFSTSHRTITVRTLRRADRGSLPKARDLSQCDGLLRWKPSMSDKYDMTRVV
jgi:hypothetical protein